MSIVDGGGANKPTSTPGLLPVLELIRYSNDTTQVLAIAENAVIPDEQIQVSGFAGLIWVGVGAVPVDCAVDASEVGRDASTATAQSSRNVHCQWRCQQSNQSSPAMAIMTAASIFKGAL